MTRRVTWPAAERLLPRLSERDISIMNSVANVRLLTGHQLTRLHFADLSPQTQDRTRRKVLSRLHDLQVVSRLERHIGGVRAGSSGWVYGLGPAGQRIQQLLTAESSRSPRIRAVWTPGTMFLSHTMAVAELYVQLAERTRLHPDFSLTAFTTEPACWWPDGRGGWLKPDALVVLTTADYDELIWLEVDRATESLPTLRKKLADYHAFAASGQTGPDGVVPHVMITAPTDKRVSEIRSLIDQLDPGSKLMQVAPFSQATGVIRSLTTASDNPP